LDRDMIHRKRRYPETAVRRTVRGREAEVSTNTSTQPARIRFKPVHLPPQKEPRVLPLEDLLHQPLPRWKRAMDVIGSAFALILFSPLMLLVAAAVKFTSRGPVIFKQPRAGMGEKPFIFYKFRSMTDGAEAMKEDLMNQNELAGPVFKITNDPRVTPVGRLLRRTSLDELPQFWNVLKGDMSLVGPRPPTLDEVPQYECWQRMRIQITPGITGIWQVSGRSDIPFDQWVRMDIHYLRNRSLLLDLGILAKTIGAVLTRRGAR